VTCPSLPGGPISGKAPNEKTDDAHIVEVPTTGEKSAGPEEEQETPSAEERSRALKREAIARLGDHHRNEQARRWRAERIKRFTQNQRLKREWINFAEIADWCSEVDGLIVSNEAARASAYEKLQRDLLDGDFEENGRSRVLYLHPGTAKAKMTLHWMKNVIETYLPTTIRYQYLDHCWIPENLFQRWLAVHHLRTSPDRFKPRLARKMPAATPPGPVTEKIAERFAAEYIFAAKAAGKHPTMAGLEASALKAGKRGGRDYLRAAFRRIQGADVRRGRPRNSPLKFAKK
jgi:hypothetical protein